MTTPGNFIVTIIALTLGVIASIIYIVLNIEPNIFWLIGLIILVGLASTLVFSIIIYAFSKLRSFETPKQLYRRQLKIALVFGMLAIVILLIQKFFDLI